MRTVFVSFSLRKDGNTARAARAGAESMEGGELVEIRETGARGCGECEYECFRAGEHCPYEGDGVWKLYQRIGKSDRCCFVVPNYSGRPGAAFFAFEERIQGIWQGDRELYKRYFAVPKKFIVVSNTGIEEFERVFRRHILEGEPDILKLAAKEYGKTCTGKGLMDSEEALSAVREFVKDKGV